MAEGSGGDEEEEIAMLFPLLVPTPLVAVKVVLASCIQLFPFQYSSWPLEISKMNSPVAGEAIAFRCVRLSRGISKPLLEAFTSRITDRLAARPVLVKPTV